MKNSIKRVQSQACLNIAERKNFRLQAKKTIFALLALVMTSVTAGAEIDPPTYSLDKAAGAEAHGQITFKVGDQTATGAKEGETVTVQITPEEGWVVNKPVGQWYAAQAMVRRRNQANTDINIDVKNVFELEKLSDVENTWSFVMERAHAEIDVLYSKIIQDLWVEDINAVTYNGEEQKPTVTVKDGEKVLVENTDFTVAYSNNIDAGTATATVTGIGNYSGTVSKQFTIEMAQLSLDEKAENAEALDEADGKYYDVRLTRTLQTGGWNSFAVPFDISSDELSAKGITAKELTGSSFLDGALTLNFTEATSIEAGKPYLVKVAETLENPTFGCVLVKKDAKTTETAAVNFVPTLGKTLVTGPAGDEGNAKAVFILGAGNKMSNPSVVNDPNSLSSYMKGFRAYFQLADNTKNVRSISLDIDEDAETAINEVHETCGADEDLILYDLQGRRVSNTKQRGLYIVNGKKVIK